jgi:hypothetical protein
MAFLCSCALNVTGYHQIQDIFETDLRSGAAADAENGTNVVSDPSFSAGQPPVRGRQLSKERSYRPLLNMPPAAFGSEARVSFACASSTSSRQTSSAVSTFYRNREDGNSRTEADFEGCLPYQTFLNKLMEEANFDLVDKIRLTVT